MPCATTVLTHRVSLSYTLPASPHFVCGLPTPSNAQKASVKASVKLQSCPQHPRRTKSSLPTPLKHPHSWKFAMPPRARRLLPMAASAHGCSVQRGSVSFSTPSACSIRLVRSSSPPFLPLTEHFSLTISRNIPGVLRTRFPPRLELKSDILGRNSTVLFHLSRLRLRRTSI